MIDIGKISLSLQRLSRQYKLNKESASLLVKSPNLIREYTKHGHSSYRWAVYPCVYSGVWRYLQEGKDDSPLSVSINIV